MRNRFILSGLLVLGALPWLVSCTSTDWNTYRHDPARTGVTAAEPARDARLIWVRTLPKPDPAWPDQKMLQFDSAYLPVASGKRLFVSFPSADKVVAYKTETGEEAWTFFAEGPIRFAPTVWKDRLYVVSDDGYLYCLRAEDGSPLWRFRGGPSDRRVLGNERVISTWPARGAPVVADGTVYFGAGIWPFMGIFLYALDAETGKIRWLNDREGDRWMLQPHKSPSFAGVAPQGYLAVAGDRLFVPSRSVPACFDRRTGELLSYELAEHNYRGGFRVTTVDDVFVNDGVMYDVLESRWLAKVPTDALAEDGSLYGTDKDNGLRAFDFTHDPDNGSTTGVKPRWNLPGPTRLHLKAGSLLYCSTDNEIIAVEEPSSGEPRIAWRTPLDPAEAGDATGESSPGSAPVSAAPDPSNLKPQTSVHVASMIAADGKLFISTTGAFGARIECYGPAEEKHEVRRFRKVETSAAARPSMLEGVDLPDGYAVALGTGAVWFLADLARTSDLRIVCVDPRAERAAAVRSQLDALGLYGCRVSTHAGDPLAFNLPPYLASVVIVPCFEELGIGPSDHAAFVRRIYELLRPYGGFALIDAEPRSRAALEEAIRSVELPGATLRAQGEMLRLERTGPLPGAADWTHQNCTPANRLISDEKRVRAPLGLLWFGGSTHYGILPRHGHGPSPQVIDGRLVIEGPDGLRAMDVYTGRVLWETELPRLGKAYDVTYHQPGANAIGSNFCSTSDGIYVAYGRRALMLDPMTGKTLKTFVLPKRPGDEESPMWGYIAVEGDLLIAGSSPVSYDWADDDYRPEEFKRIWFKTRDKLVLGVRQWRGVEIGDRLDGESDSAFLARSFNMLLREKRLAECLPLRFRQAAMKLSNETILQLQRQVDDYVAEHPELKEADAKLKYLNRRLLDEYYVSSLGSARAFWDGVTSRRLAAMDRHTGEVKWTNEAAHGFWHNAIAIGGGKIFCIDRVPRELVRVGETVNQPVEASACLSAFDLATGEKVWSTEENVFGTWLAYSGEHKLLVQAGRRSRDMLVDEVGMRMIAYTADTGDVVWDRPMVYWAPIMLVGERLLTQTDAYSLLTGEPLVVKDPLTGRERDWRYSRQYGCGTIIGCENLLTFRSAAAGFYDLISDGGTANLGGFKSGCTANLVPAGGVLNAPDYTRTCTCSYQNQTSLALVHDDSVDAWTFSSWDLDNAPITRLGLNLGAPGDRRADDGTLWLEYPYVGGPTPSVPVATLPATPRVFRRHTAVMPRDPLRWIGASGMTGLRSITVTLAPKPVDPGLHALGPDVAPGPTHEGSGPQQQVTERPYTVRLYFVEPGVAGPGHRVFRAAVRGQGEPQVVDPARDAPGPWRVVVREFTGVRVVHDLTIDLDPLRSAKVKSPVLCGIEVIAEGWENPPIERPVKKDQPTQVPENGD